MQESMAERRVSETLLLVVIYPDGLALSGGFTVTYVATSCCSGARESKLKADTFERRKDGHIRTRIRYRNLQQSKDKTVDYCIW